MVSYDDSDYFTSKSDRVMEIVLTLGRGVMGIIHAHGPHRESAFL